MDSKALKVCDVVQFYSTLSGGVRRYIHEKIEYLKKNTPHSHILVVPSHRDAFTREGKNCVYEIKSTKLIGSNSYRMLISKKKILAAISKECPDLIEVGDPYRAAWIGLRAAKDNKIPIVAFYHSDYPRALDRTLRKYVGTHIESLVSPLIRRYLIQLYNRMSATVVSSKRCEEALAEIGIQNLKRIALGTNLETFTPQDSRYRILKELGLTPQCRLLLFVGRLAREKNIRSLFDMMDELETHSEEYHLLLIGDGEWRDEVRRKSRENRRISWLHFCESSDRLADFYSAADLFVHAGDCETFGLVSLEAQACGTRVLAVRGGGLDEGLQYEEPLIMAKDTSGKALAEAVDAIWKLKETRTNRELRRQKIEQHFSWDVTFSKLTHLYTTLAAAPCSDAEKPQTTHHESQDPAILS